MRISDWSSDVCSSDLLCTGGIGNNPLDIILHRADRRGKEEGLGTNESHNVKRRGASLKHGRKAAYHKHAGRHHRRSMDESRYRSEEQTPKLPSLMRISYAVFSLRNKTCRQPRRRSHMSPIITKTPRL